jgi:hypothetical protein
LLKMHLADRSVKTDERTAALSAVTGTLDIIRAAAEPVYRTLLHGSPGRASSSRLGRGRALKL